VRALKILELLIKKDVFDGPAEHFIKAYLLYISLFCVFIIETQIFHINAISMH